MKTETPTIHLDEARYRALLAGSLPEEEARALEAHLAADCEVCETFLAARVDVLDGLVDDAALSVRVASTARPPDGATAPARARSLGRPLRWAAATGALAAAAALFLVFFVSELEPEVRQKGTVPDPTVAVELEVLRVDGGEPVPLTGAPLPQGSTVVFRLRLDAPACVQLWRDESPLLDTPRCLDPGAHVLADGDHPLGLTLDRPGRVEIRAAPASRSPASAPPVVVEVVGSGE